MIIGNGLIAKHFIDSKNQEDKIIFASGVSNSLEDNVLHYNREISLIKDIIHKYKNKKIIYFSTMSIFNVNSSYTSHKLFVENIIKASQRYSIYRLPQIIGLGGNKNNLINFFIDKILRKQEIQILSGPKKSVLDIEDLVKISENTWDLKDQQILNIAGIELKKPKEIAEIISQTLGVDLIFSLINNDYKEFSCENSLEIEEVINKLNIRTSFYTEKVIQKYIKK